MAGIAQALYGPPWLSLMTTVIGNGVFVTLFLFVAIFTRRFRLPTRWCLRGVAFGLLVLPLALWFYAQFFAGPLRALVFGLPGLLLLAHFAPLQEVGSVSHSIVLNPAAGASQTLGSAYLAGSALWMGVYGLLGLGLGAVLQRRRREAGA